MNSKSALSGISILDLTMLAPGPYATLLLGDLGANIIKIESPNYIDRVRYRAPLINELKSEGYGGYFSILNRNKKSLVLDLKKDEGKEIFYNLAKKADVIIESFRPGVKHRLKIDYETIKKINPQIIYCSLTGYGQEGPYKNLPGHDLNYISLSGLVSLNASRGGEPILPSTQVADFGGAMSAVISILSALIARDKHGEGQYLDIALMDVSFSWILSSYIDYFLTSKLPIPAGERLTGGHPGYNVYKTKDGKFISLCALEEKFWENLFDYFKKPEYKDQKLIEIKGKEIKKFLENKFLEKNRDNWVKELKDLDVCVMPVLEMNEVRDDPQVSKRQIFKEFKDKELGTISQIMTPLKLSRTPIEVRCRAPLLGENSDEILSKLGYKNQEIEEFRRKNVIK